MLKKYNEILPLSIKLAIFFFLKTVPLIKNLRKWILLSIYLQWENKLI